jgi:type II secretory pathway component PulF
VSLANFTNFKWLRQQLSLIKFRLQRADFYRDLAEMFRRNEALINFLEGEIGNAIKTSQHSRLLALRLVLARHQSGHQAGRLDHLLGYVMPRSDAMMLVGATRAHDKSAALLALAHAVDKQTAMKKLVLTYAALPCLVAPLAYGLILLLGAIVLQVDKIAPISTHAALWQGLNGWSRAVALFFQSYGLGFVITLLLLLSWALYSLPRWRGRTRLWADSLPLYGLYRDFQSSLLFASMAMLLQTGGTLKGSLQDIAQRSSAWMRWHIHRVLSALDENPTATLDAFSRGILSPHLLARSATLLRTADSFSQVLIELGTREEARVLSQLKRAAVLANAAILAGLVSLAVFMAVACVTVPGSFATLSDPNRVQNFQPPASK